MNKLKKVFGVFLGATMLLGVGTAFIKARFDNQMKEVNAAISGNYSIAGVYNDWSDDTATKFAADGVKHLIRFGALGTNQWKFKKNETWSDAIGYSKIISSLKTANIIMDANKDDNCYFSSSSYAEEDYYVWSSGDNIYVEPALYYAGNGGTHTDGRPSNYSSWTDKPLRVGDTNPVRFNFTTNEKFKFKFYDTWDSSVGYNEATSDYKGTDDIHWVDGSYDMTVLHDGNYDVWAYYDNGYKVSIKFADTDTIYVLDLNSDLLSSNARGYTFNSNGNKNATWPGASMAKVDGTKNIYSLSYLNFFDTLIINNGTTQTIDYTLSTVKNKCLVLDWAYDEGQGKWISNTWVNLEAAKYIDSYLKFETYHQDNNSSNNDCATNYSAAKSAYNASSFADYRQDVCSVDLALARLQAWARANHEIFSVSNGVGSFSAARITNVITSQESNNALTIITIIASIGVLTTGAYMFFKKGKKVEQ